MTSVDAEPAPEPSTYLDGAGWVSALDSNLVQRTGSWRESRFRYARTTCLGSEEDAAKLTFAFAGTGVSLGLGQHAVAAYGQPSLGKLKVTIDGGPPHTVYPRDEGREVVLARDLTPGKHRVVVEHLADGAQRGCRISGFRVLPDRSGDLAFVLNGEENGFFVDARAEIWDGDRVIRRVLTRNWITGACRLTGLPAGDRYSLDLIAYGWEPRRIDGISISPGEETSLASVYLERLSKTRPQGILFPALGRPAVRRPGESFRARFRGYDQKIRGALLSRQVGPAVVSRKVKIEEDADAAFYYDREGTVTVPEGMPPGLYDLSIQVSGSRGDLVRRSARSVYVVRDYPRDPVFMTFGHLDTQGQYQAEYERRLAELANLIAVDMVLISNAVNPAYISGAHLPLDMPYAITFGNHQFSGHERWFGDPVGIIDYGPNLSILNFGDPWHVDLSRADALFAARCETRIKVINAFEHNAPVETFLDKHGVQLIHDGHGPGAKVMEIGATPTVRVGKSNSMSFRVVRFKEGRVLSATYRGDDVAPIPFAREEESPIRVLYDPPNDGTHSKVTATVVNKLEEAFPGCRVTFILPAGNYVLDGGQLEEAIMSDDERYTVLTARVDVSQKETASVTVSRNP